MSSMFSVPVIWYIRPMPISRKVAPIVPMMRYENAAVSARRLRPMAIRMYDANEEISRKTKTLKTSPVIVTPSRPHRQSRIAA